MERRELIKLLGLSTGAVLSVPMMSSLLISCKDAAMVADENYKLKFFNKEEFIFVKNIIDIILPKTDSPSASEIGVHKIIDTMAVVYGIDFGVDFRKKLTKLMNFSNSSSNDLDDVVHKLSKSLAENEKEIKELLFMLKQLTVTYYLTSEEISKNYLNFLPIPGKYEPCISLDEVGGKSWAI